MPQALARITPQRLTVNATQPALTSREKAAIIVRLLLAEGSRLPLSSLPEHLQAALTEQMANMRLVDRATLQGVVAEFLDQLEGVGLSFPGGLEGALSMLDGHISPSAASRLRRLAGASGKVDPWERIVPMPPERLLPLLEGESVEIGAVMLSKLPVGRAADLLGRLPGEKARRIAHAMALTGDIDPDTVRRIGLALAGQLDAQPPRAFDAGPEERVGAILNVTSAALRDALLDGLTAEDEAFAARVRRAIFTFAHLPERVAPRDLPRLIRGVDQPVLITALAGSGPEFAPVVEFILANLGQRMAQTLRDEIASAGPVREREAEAARNALIEAARNLDAQGEIRLIREEED